MAQVPPIALGVVPGEMAEQESAHGVRRPRWLGESFPETLRLYVRGLLVCRRLMEEAGCRVEKLSKF